MSSWQSFLKADPTPWLLEPENPSVRYFTLVNKQNQLGQWKQQHVFPKTKSQGFMPIPIDLKGQPSKWVTLRAISTLKRHYS